MWLKRIFILLLSCVLLCSCSKQDTTHVVQNSAIVGTIAADSSGVYTLHDDAVSSAQIATVDGKTVVVFASNNSKEEVQTSSVMYTVFDGVMWTTPKEVCTEVPVGVEPYLYVYNDELFLTYMGINKTIKKSTDDKYNTFYKNYEIVSCKFDGAAFVTEVITKDKTIDRSPILMEVDGVVTAVWISNKNGTYLYEISAEALEYTKEDVIKYSQYVNGKWTKPSTLCAKTNAVLDFTVGVMNNTAYVATVIDNDNAVKTSNDSKVVLHSFDGEQVELIGDLEVQNIYYTDIAGAQYFTCFDLNERNFCYWSDITASYAWVYTTDVDLSFDSCMRDGKVCSTKIIDGKEVLCFVDSVGEHTVVTTMENVIFYTLNDTWIVYCEDVDDDFFTWDYILKCFKYTETNNVINGALDLLYVGFDTSDIVPNEKLPVELYITNDTAEQLHSIEVVIETDTDVVLTETVTCDIACGESDWLTVYLDVPDIIDATEYTVYVYDNKTQIESNSEQFNLAYTTLNVTAKSTLKNNKNFFEVAIENTSAVDTDCTLYINSVGLDEDIVYHTEVIDNVTAYTTYTATINTEKLFTVTDTDNSKVVEVVVEYTQNGETYRESIQEYAAIMSADIPYVTVAFLDVERNELSREVYDVGVDIVPLDLPDGAVGWYKLGDATQTLVTDFTNIQQDVVYIAKAS